jgi:hypothetical protein
MRWTTRRLLVLVAVGAGLMALWRHAAPTDQHHLASGRPVIIVNEPVRACLLSRNQPVNTADGVMDPAGQVPVAVASGTRAIVRWDVGWYTTKYPFLRATRARPVLVQILDGSCAGRYVVICRANLYPTH